MQCSQRGTTGECIFKNLPGATSLHMCAEGLVSLGTEARNIVIVLNLLYSAIQAEADSDEVYAQIMLQPEADVSLHIFNLENIQVLLL